MSKISEAAQALVQAEAEYNSCLEKEAGAARDLDAAMKNRRDMTKKRMDAQAKIEAAKAALINSI